MTESLTQQLLARYRHLALHNDNEAATRLKVIDHVLRGVLGWTDDDISPEEHVSEDGTTTYSDYILRTANTAIVVEAKKAGAAFNTSRGQRRVKLGNAFLQSELGAAIVQARDYARKLSIDFAVATNGATWAVFPAQRHDQVKFHDSSAFVFWSLEEALQENYQEFVDLLSREAVISGSLERALLGRAENQVENRKLNSYFTANPRITQHNPVFPIIEDEVMVAFSDSIVELPHESFEKCYVATPESMKFDNKIKMQIARRDSVIGGQIARPMKDKDAQALYERVVATGKKRRPLALLVLGTVGSGKTTFLHYARKVRLADFFGPKGNGAHPQWAHLDFLNNPPESSATDFIYRSLRDYINADEFLSDASRCVEKAYADDIRAIKSGPLARIANSEEKLNEKISDFIFNDYQQVTPYVDRIIRFATSTEPFFLAIDNVDQIEDEEVQSRLFTEALTIARKLSVNLILSLRPATFAKHRHSPAIDAFDFESVQIDPPKISSVISKRFSLVRFLADGKKGEFTAENGARVRVDNASQIVDLLQGSVLGTEIGARIEVLATEDVRLALRMTREFLERGYTNPGRAIAFHQRTGKYVLPRHEAFRAIILGTKTVYNEDFSPIGNPFDSRLSVTRAQLLRLYVLSAAVAYASDAKFRFLDGLTISENLRKIGFGDTYTEEVLADLCKHRFLFTANHGEPSISSSYIPSRLGGYVVRELLANFTFLENTLFDTYIAVPGTWNELKELSYRIDAERNMVNRTRLRAQRVRLFFNFASECYAPLVEESQKRGLPSQWCSNPFAERSQDLRGELSRVLRSARSTFKRSRQLAAQSLSQSPDYADIEDPEDLNAVQHGATQGSF